MRKFFALFLIGFSIFAQNKKSFTILLPGVEQIKSRKYAKGIILAGSFLSFSVAAFVENKKGYDFYDKYKVAADLDSVVYYRSKTEDSFKRRNIFILGAFSIWVLHIIDLKFFSKKGKKKTSIGGGIEKGGLNICFNFSF